MSYCCEMMEEQLTKECTSFTTDELGDYAGPSHPRRFDCPDVILAEFRTGVIGIIIHDSSSSVIAIDYCPWCGSKLEKTI